MNKIAYRTSCWGTQRGLHYIYICIEATPLGQSFPCAVYRLPHPFEAQRKRRRAKTRAGRKKRGEHASRCGCAPVGRRWHGDLWISMDDRWMYDDCMMHQNIWVSTLNKDEIVWWQPLCLCERIIEYWKSICTSHQDQVVSLLHCNHRTAKTRRVEHHGCIERSDWCRDLRFDHMAPWCDHMRPQQSQRP